MAGYELIDTYLQTLEGRIRWRPDRDEIVAEARDHLYSTAEQFERGGDTHRDAQIATIHRFGNTDQVAVALATTDSGRLAVPTESTRGAGFGAMAAAAGWVTVVGCWFVSNALDDGTWPSDAQAAWMVGAVALIGSAALTVAVMWLLRERHGGLGPLGLAGIVVAALGGLVTLAGWLFFGWGGLIGLGALLFAIPMLQRSLAPRWATICFAAAWPIAALTWSVVRWFELGSPDEWGDYWSATFAGLGVGVAVFALGLFGLGRWLRSEEPAELPVPPTLART